MKFKIEELRVKLTGTRPLLLSRGEAANPFDAQAIEIRKISQKRNKSPEDHEALSRLQFISACYYDEKIGIYLPSENVFKAMQQGAAKFKEAQLVKSLVIVKGLNGNQLEPGGARIMPDGDMTPDELYNAGKCVSRRMGKMPGNRSSVLVTRPVFPQWTVSYQIEFSELTPDRVFQYLELAGRLIGIGTWRPQFGTFIVEII